MMKSKHGYPSTLTNPAGWSSPILHARQYNVDAQKLAVKCQLTDLAYAMFLFIAFVPINTGMFRTSHGTCY